MCSSKFGFHIRVRILAVISGHTSWPTIWPRPISSRWCWAPGVFIVLLIQLFTCVIKLPERSKCVDDVNKFIYHNICMSLSRAFFICSRPLWLLLWPRFARRWTWAWAQTFRKYLCCCRIVVGIKTANMTLEKIIKQSVKRSDCAGNYINCLLVPSELPLCVRLSAYLFALSEWTDECNEI